jgi:hypothetical protein
MAALTVTPERPGTGDNIHIHGTGFTPSAPLRLSVPEAGVVIKSVTSPTGTFESDDILDWSPGRIGIFTLVADDGTNTVTKEIQIWT